MNVESSKSTLHMFESTRVKRKGPTPVAKNEKTHADALPITASSKRARKGRIVQEEYDSIADKENFHRSKQLAPRARPAKILVDLVVDLPTDCTDYEISDGDEGDVSPSSLGRMFQRQFVRMSDPKSKHYNFTVFEDAAVAS